MYFTGYVLQKGIYVDAAACMRIMLYNGRKVFIRGKDSDNKGSLSPGDLVEFMSQGDFDLETDQPSDTYYKTSLDWIRRITDETTISTFFIGVRALCLHFENAHRLHDWVPANSKDKEFTQDNPDIRT